MTTPTPTPEEQDLPASPDSGRTNPSPEVTTGFFKRVRQKLNFKQELVHPSEAAEIVIMDEPDNTDDRT
jgi:hypothetical protein